MLIFDSYGNYVPVQMESIYRPVEIGVSVRRA